MGVCRVVMFSMAHESANLPEALRRKWPPERIISNVKSFSSPHFGRLALTIALVFLAMTGVARTQDKGGMGLPLLFDAREHLPRPDISAYPRLRFVTTADFPPFNFADQGDRLSGFHVDLVREICAVLAVEARCQVQALPFSELEAALKAGQVEAVIAGVAITPERRAEFAFSRSYMPLPARFAVRSKAPVAEKIPSPDWRVGIVAGSAHEAMFRAYFPHMKPALYDSQALLLAGLKEGKVDAAFSDALRLVFWTASGASENCCAMVPGAYVSERYLGEGLAIMVRREDAVLAAAFDHALAELSSNGRLEEIYLRYFPAGLF